MSQIHHFQNPRRRYFRRFRHRRARNLTLNELQFEIVARCYLKQRMLGRQPEQTISSIGRADFDLDEQTILNTIQRARQQILRIGIPTIAEELDEPQHRRAEPPQTERQRKRWRI